MAGVPKSMGIKVKPMPQKRLDEVARAILSTLHALPDYPSFATRAAMRKDIILICAALSPKVGGKYVKDYEE